MKRGLLSAVVSVLALAGLGLFATSADAHPPYVGGGQSYYPYYRGGYQLPALYPPIRSYRDAACYDRGDYRLMPQSYYNVPYQGSYYAPQDAYYGNQYQSSYYTPQYVPSGYQYQGSYYPSYGYQNQGSYYPQTVIIRR